MRPILFQGGTIGWNTMKSSSRGNLCFISVEKGQTPTDTKRRASTSSNCDETGLSFPPQACNCNIILEHAAGVHACMEVDMCTSRFCRPNKRAPRYQRRFQTFSDCFGVKSHPNCPNRRTTRGLSTHHTKKMDFLRARRGVLLGGVTSFDAP